MLAQQLTGLSNQSAFMARHMEQPGSRHSETGGLEDLVEPSRSACSLTERPSRARPWPAKRSWRLTSGQTMTTVAASRMSSMRLLVATADEHLNPRDVGDRLAGAQGPCRSGRARSRRAEKSLFSLSGSGHHGVRPAPSRGWCPGVTCGTISAALSSTTASTARRRGVQRLQLLHGLVHSTPVGSQRTEAP